MFESKKCKNCGKRLKKDWTFCPSCGHDTRDRYKRHYDMIDDIEKEFERIDEIFGPKMFKFPRIDIKPMTRNSGISITIRRGTGMKPKINVKTSGNYKKIEPQIKRKLGIGDKTEQKAYKERKIPKVTEEPETKIVMTGNVKKILIKLPDVKNINDIEIRKLRQSLEIKGFAGDKAYFKLIPIRPNAQISNKSFNNGILTIEMI
jgi:RNA polymerase subunit RPABC4/transcription elongation factor Spt4